MAIISICRGTKSGGDALARCLATRLGWPMLGREALQEAAAQIGVPSRDLELKMEEKPGVFGRANLMTRLYVAALRSAIAEAATSGNLIYHGLAGGRLLTGVSGVVCVRLIAPLEHRIRALMESEGMERGAAEAYIRDVDDARARWVRLIHGVDIADPSLYDLVVSLETFSIPDVCELLVRLVEQPELAITPERLADLWDFRIQSQVNLALLEDLGTQSLNLEARVRRGIVEVTGQAPMTRTGDVGDRIAEIVSAVPGADELHLKLEWFDPYP